MKIQIIPVVALILGISVPLSSMAESPTRGDASRGVRIWANQCGRCHNMRLPDEFSAQEWHVIVSHMRVRAGLTGQQVRDINAYVRKTKE